MLDGVDDVAASAIRVFLNAAQTFVFDFAVIGGPLMLLAMSRAAREELLTTVKRRTNAVVPVKMIENAWGG